MRIPFKLLSALLVLPLAFTGCDDTVPYGPGGDGKNVYVYANGCYSLALGENPEARTFLAATSDGESYSFSASALDDASRFTMKASDLGTYLLYDAEEHYLYSEAGAVQRTDELQNDVALLDDNYISGAEWILEDSARKSEAFQLRNRRQDNYLGVDEMVDAANNSARLYLVATSGCAEFPEMSIDATGSIARTTYDDGTLFGIADTHSHILANFGFGGGGIAHGAPFHRLGVEHAMMDCEQFHGEDGRADFLGFGFDARSSGGLDVNSLLELVTAGALPEPQHNTDGWPTFSGWPSTFSSTHQTQYYRWLERAWMGGLRVMVQHAVSNEAICQLVIEGGFQDGRYDCADMLNIDRQIVEAFRMQDYIDAQYGGPGKGFFRIVETPEQARQVVEDGKLAILLGIEVPNLFDCYLNPPEGAPVCDEAHIRAELDKYYDMGVRVIFPVHKYDNAFTSGDGDRGIIELGNFLQTGHYSNFTQEDCPESDARFDNGPIQFGGLNQPRDDYFAPAIADFTDFADDLVGNLFPYIGALTGGSLEGDWCQKQGMTELGETLMRELANRGFIIEIDHFSRRSYLRAHELLAEMEYPAAATHGSTAGGQVYELGGVSKAGIRRCSSEPGDLMNSFLDRVEMIEAAGNHPGEGFGFDLNGFAGIPQPRFGEYGCSNEQENPVEYPFTSFDGGVTFTQPFMGDREVDFNTEGMIHIGLMPELIEDARRTGSPDEDLDILFRSAEAYVQMWEYAEERGEILSASPSE